MSELANGGRPPFSNDSRPPFAGTGWSGGAHDLSRVVSPRFASSHGTVTISQSRDRRSGLPACQYPDPMALHVALCRHLDHAEQHSAELVRRLRPSPLHRINILVGSGVASRYTQRRLATPQADQLGSQPPTRPTQNAARWPTSHSSPPSISPARLPLAAPAPPTRRCPMARTSRCCNASSTNSHRRAASSSSGPTSRACPRRWPAPSATCATRTSTPTSWPPGRWPARSRRATWRSSTNAGARCSRRSTSATGRPSTRPRSTRRRTSGARRSARRR